MDIQNLVNTVMTTQLSTLGAEACDFDGVSINIVLGEMRKEIDVYGGERARLTLSGSTPTNAVSIANIIEEGIATVRGVRMKVASTAVGKAMTEIEFEEANKVKK
jgi:hypothetical protein